MRKKHTKRKEIFTLNQQGNASWKFWNSNFRDQVFLWDKHCVRSVPIRIFSGPYFRHLDWIRKDTEQKKFECGLFSHSDACHRWWCSDGDACLLCFRQNSTMQWLKLVRKLIFWFFYYKGSSSQSVLLTSEEKLNMKCIPKYWILNAQRKNWVTNYVMHFFCTCFTNSWYIIQSVQIWKAIITIWSADDENRVKILFFSGQSK